jgi:hypothetical protein
VCARRKQAAPEISSQDYERIPVGLLVADACGKVLDHEHPKYRALIGRNLFTSVACLTLVDGLAGWFYEFLSGGENYQIFSLPFRIGEDELHVQIFFWRICSELSLIRIWVTKASAG